MRLKKVIRLFDQGNVSVCGLRGCGKDMLMANVVIRRNIPYISNIDYGGGAFADGGLFIPLNFADLNCGGNTYRNFISGNVKPYCFPYPDGTDVYISDAGVFLPSQYCNELNRDYGYLATYMALSRHLGANNVHFNSQNLNRVYDKIREQSDIYISCNKCFYLFGFVLQIITTYDRYQCAVDRVPPFRLSRSLFSADRKYDYEKERMHYMISYGLIKRRILFYRNKSTYDTRRFKEMLANA